MGKILKNIEIMSKENYEVIKNRLINYLKMTGYYLDEEKIDFFKFSKVRNHFSANPQKMKSEFSVTLIKKEGKLKITANLIIYKSFMTFMLKEDHDYWEEFFIIIKKIFNGENFDVSQLSNLSTKAVRKSWMTSILLMPLAILVGGIISYLLINFISCFLNLIYYRPH